MSGHGFAAAFFPDVVEVAARALNLTFDPACDAVRLPAGPGKEFIVKKVTVEIDFAGRKYSLTTGELAKQSSGAVMIQHGDTSVFVASQTGPGRPGMDFFPLQVDYRERLAAAGKFAGGYLKREGRPTTREVLTATAAAAQPPRVLMSVAYSHVRLPSNEFVSTGHQ